MFTLEDLIVFVNDIIQTRVFWFIAGATMASIVIALGIGLSVQKSQKKLFTKRIAKAQAKWRDCFREDVSTFCSLATRHYYKVKDLDSHLIDLTFSADLEKLNQLRVKTRLRLNPYERIDSPDTKLIRSMGRVILQFETKQYTNLHRELIRIERCSQRILKSEWDKSKREAIKGRLEIRH